MKIKFKCTLLSDVVLNEISSSEGKQRSIDFIPGNNFLGIVAAELYGHLPLQESEAVFHSGKVRFGDAHPSNGGIRGLKVPASMYYPKMGKETEECYIHHLIDNQDLLKEKQLKQCREGFYLFDREKATGTKIDVMKNFSIKSAYDSKKRRSKDECMFGYESLPKGLTMYFEVDSDLDETTNIKIEKALTGTKHIGRSRSAQYGLVLIEKTDFQDAFSSQQATENYVVVYADGRLIFLNEDGEPTFQPTAADLGFSKGEIDIAKSQVRTFQYSPWNGKRQTYDTDRCGIEKGSVFIVKNVSGCSESSNYVGAYVNEGFGKVIYNPEFLLPKSEGENGLAMYRLIDQPCLENNIIMIPRPSASALVNFLEEKRKEEISNTKVYDSVQVFIENSERKKLFKKDSFASQWGSIRSLAMVTSDAQLLIQNIDNYLNHGIAKDKWEERGRKKTLDAFMEKHKQNNLQDIMINLASEMAKRCKNKKED